MINTTKELLRNKYKLIRNDYMNKIDPLNLQSEYEKIGQHLFKIIKQNFKIHSCLSKHNLFI